MPAKGPHFLLETRANACRSSAGPYSARAETDSHHQQAYIRRNYTFFSGYLLGAVLEENRRIEYARRRRRGVEPRASVESVRVLWAREGERRSEMRLFVDVVGKLESRRAFTYHIYVFRIPISTTDRLGCVLCAARNNPHQQPNTAQSHCKPFNRLTSCSSPNAHRERVRAHSGYV